MKILDKKALPHEGWQVTLKDKGQIYSALVMPEHAIKLLAKRDGVAKLTINDHIVDVVMCSDGEFYDICIDGICYPELNMGDVISRTCGMAYDEQEAVCRHLYYRIYSLVVYSDACTWGAQNAFGNEIEVLEKKDNHVKFKVTNRHYQACIFECDIKDHRLVNGLVNGEHCAENIRCTLVCFGAGFGGISKYRWHDGAFRFVGEVKDQDSFFKIVDAFDWLDFGLIPFLETYNECKTN